MLYLLQAPFIFCQAIEKICGGCTKACNKCMFDTCNGVAKCLEDTCGGVCKGFSCIFTGIGKCLSGIVYVIMSIITGIIKCFCSCIRIDQPLGIFVICALVFNGPAAREAYNSYTSCQEMSTKVVGIACVVNMLVAVYLKLKVNYQGSTSNDPMEDDLDASAMVKKQTAVKPSDTLAKINYVLKYDVTFCLYFLAAIICWWYVLIAVFGVLFGSGSCLDSGSSVMFILYMPFCCCYGCAFYCCYAGMSIGQAGGDLMRKPKANNVPDANKQLLPK